MAIKVAVVGQGTIGSGVAAGVKRHEDMELVGVAKSNAGNIWTQLALQNGWPIYTTHGSESFDKLDIRTEGKVEKLLDKADVVVDCSPASFGAQNKERLYTGRDIGIVYQGGEKADVAHWTFSSYVNMEKLHGRSDIREVRVLSCNGTALGRATLLASKLGNPKITATLFRRASDVHETKGSTNNAVAFPNKVPGHQSDDLKRLLPDLDITSIPFVNPSPYMHMHSIVATYEEPIKYDAWITFADTTLEYPRIMLMQQAHGFGTNAELMEFARRTRFGGGLYELVVSKETVQLLDMPKGGYKGKQLFFSQAVDQEHITIPDTLDAIVTVSGKPHAGAKETREKTDRALGIPLIQPRKG